MGFILMYDITNEESFNSVQDWSVAITMSLYFSNTTFYHPARRTNNMSDAKMCSPKTVVSYVNLVREIKSVNPKDLVKTVNIIAEHNTLYYEECYKYNPLFVKRNICPNNG